MVCILLSGCTNGTEETVVSSADAQDIATSSVPASEEPVLLECTPAYRYESVLPFRIRLTKDNKLKCTLPEYGDVYLLRVNGEKVELNSITNGFYAASKETEVEVLFKDTSGKKFKKSFFGTDFIEEVAEPVYTQNPTFDCIVDGEFVKNSEGLQKIKTPYSYGALRGATVKVSFESTVDYPDISLKDTVGADYYPTSVSNGVAVFKANYIQSDFNVCCPLGVQITDVSVQSVKKGAVKRKSFTVEEASGDEQSVSFLLKDATATAKLIAPDGQVYYFSRSSTCSTGTIYEAIIPNALVGKYKVIVKSKYKIRKLRRLPIQK